MSLLSTATIEPDLTKRPTNALSFSSSCMVDRLLEKPTIQAMGANTTCRWANDSEEVVVYYDEEADAMLEPTSTISLLGG